MRARIVYYAYPKWHKVSFTIIAEKHVRELRKYCRVYDIDELAFPHMVPAVKPVVLVHPFFYPMCQWGKIITYNLRYYRALIGVDVADSDKLTPYAVRMTHYAHAMIVPSTWCRRVFEQSGVKVPVYVVPHGVEKWWYEAPKAEPRHFKDLWKLKREKKLKLLLYFLVHSDYRKGADLVLQFYEKLRKERKDVVLVMKSPGIGPAQQRCMQLGGIVITGWLKEDQMLELFDLCDAYLLFSRGGGFEVNGLEAIARGLMVIAPKGGSWEDYLPEFCLVKSRPCPYVLKDNPIHGGGGVEIDVDRALDKLHEFLENEEEYRAKIREHVEKNVKHVFNWEAIGRRLYEIVSKFF